MIEIKKYNEIQRTVEERGRTFKDTLTNLLQRTDNNPEVVEAMTKFLHELDFSSAQQLSEEQITKITTALNGAADVFRSIQGEI